MGLFGRDVDLSSPRGAVEFLLKNDSNPTVRFFRRDRKGLVAEIEASWDGCTREERLSDLRSAYRFFLTATQSDWPPFEELAPPIQTTVALAGAKSRIMGFLWERVYGESMQDVASDWRPLSDREAEALLARAGIRVQLADPSLYALQAAMVAEALESMSDEHIQPADRVMLSAAARAGARVADGIAASVHDPPDLVRPFAVCRDSGDERAAREVVAALGWFFVLTFISNYDDGFAGDRDEWATSMGALLSGFTLDPQWCVETYRSFMAMARDEAAGDFCMPWACGVLSPVGADEHPPAALAAAFLLPDACSEEMGAFARDLESAGV